MHVRTTLVLGLLLLGTAFAGCVEEASEVTVDADREGVTAATLGAAAIQYQDAHSPANESTMGATGTVDETTGQETSCAGDETGSEEVECTPAATKVNLTFETLPLPGASPYKAFFVANGSELELGDLVYNEHAMHEGEGGFLFSLHVTLDENVQGQYDAIEIRYGAFVLATAAAAGGTNDFVVVPSVLAVDVSASYAANVITVNAQGLPEGAEPTGWLVEQDADGELVHTVDFPLSGNVSEFTAERPIAAYAEFHVHVADSKINLAIASLAPAADA